MRHNSEPVVYDLPSVVEAGTYNEGHIKYGACK